MNVLSDPSAERAVLAIICRHGDVAYTEIADILNDQSFTIDSNKIIFKCIQKICNSTESNQIDVASIYSAARELNLDHKLEKKEEVQHLKAILDFPAKVENLRKFAAKIRKLDIARKLYAKIDQIKDDLLDIDGSEPITQIIGMVEEPILSFGTNLDDSEDKLLPVGHGLMEYLANLKANPVTQIGISTGFPVFDSAIGGGLRGGTINVVGARPKTGKTVFADNVGCHVAIKLNIPVLNLDTEMTTEDHYNRILAMLTETEINMIETGKFGESPMLEKKIMEAAEKLANAPLTIKSIAGKPFDEQISLMRRWIIKEVGLKSDGTANPCVIIYDYLKLMDSAGISQDMKEYQILGFMMTALHNFAHKYKVPILAFMQLNRDGITKESTDSASMSDRIIWLCSNFSIFKKKSDEEIAEDGPTNGNRKLITLIARHGGGLEDNDYINCYMKGWCAKIIEGKTKLELAGGSNNDTGFKTRDKTDEDIPFD